MADPDTCAVPPPGWYCTRLAGHSGPCAAWPDDRNAKAVVGPQPGRCAEHGGLMWNTKRVCLTPDDVVRGGCVWRPLDSGSDHSTEDRP